MNANNTKDWIVSKSLDDISIEKYCKDIFSKPTLVGDIPMYTTTQMKAMFKYGYEKGIEKIAISPYAALRQMDVSDRIRFPYDKWDSVRVSAAKLKKQFGCVFQVHKLGMVREEGEIEVVRMS